MNWRDTVMGDDQLGDCYFNPPTTMLNEFKEWQEVNRHIATAQAKITWPIAYKAGQEAEREKWLEKDKLQFCERHKLYRAGTCCDCMLEIGRREMVGWIEKTMWLHECDDLEVLALWEADLIEQLAKWGIEIKPKLCPKCGCDVAVWESELREKHKCPEDK